MIEDVAVDGMIMSTSVAIQVEGTVTTTSTCKIASDSLVVSSESTMPINATNGQEATAFREHARTIAFRMTTGPSLIPELQWITSSVVYAICSIKTKHD